MGAAHWLETPTQHAQRRGVEGGAREHTREPAHVPILLGVSYTGGGNQPTPQIPTARCATVILTHLAWPQVVVDAPGGWAGGAGCRWCAGGVGGGGGGHIATAAALLCLHCRRQWKPRLGRRTRAPPRLKQTTPRRARACRGGLALPVGSVAALDGGRPTSRRPGAPASHPGAVAAATRWRGARGRVVGEWRPRPHPRHGTVAVSGTWRGRRARPIMCPPGLARDDKVRGQAATRVLTIKQKNKHRAEEWGSG